MENLIAIPITVGVLFLIYLSLVYFFTNIAFKSARHDELMLEKFEEYKKDI